MDVCLVISQPKIIVEVFVPKFPPFVVPISCWYSARRVIENKSVEKGFDAQKT